MLSPARLLTIFHSPAENRLRAGWRLAGVWLLLQTLLLLLDRLNDLLNRLSAPTGLVNLLRAELGTALAVTLAVWLARSILDRRPLVGLGLKPGSWMMIDLTAGVVISGLIFFALYWTERRLGWIEFHGLVWQTPYPPPYISLLLRWLLAYSLVAWQEELFNRGYILQNITSGLNLVWGVILSSAIFALLHGLTQPLGWGAYLGLFAVGLLFAAGYIRTRRLWLAMGLHLGWNFFQGPVFGFPVSGRVPFGVFQHTVTGPVLWTGSPFGPEGGLMILPAAALGIGLVLVYTSLRSRVQRMFSPSL
jgi:membrane protease YdiL (CAAX protease family)